MYDNIENHEIYLSAQFLNWGVALTLLLVISPIAGPIQD